MMIRKKLGRYGLGCVYTRCSNINNTRGTCITLYGSDLHAAYHMF